MFFPSIASSFPFLFGFPGFEDRLRSDGEFEGFRCDKTKDLEEIHVVPWFGISPPLYEGRLCLMAGDVGEAG